MNITTLITHDTVTPWHFKQRHADIIAAAMPEAKVTITHTKEEFLEKLPDTQVALTWFFQQEWFALAPNLRVLSTPAAGKDYFHVIPPTKVTMLNGHFHGEIIAETVVGMILAVTRGILPSATTFKNNPWPRQQLTPGMKTLRNANVTILGFGHIGRWIGKLLKPFGTHIWGMARNTRAPKPDWFDDQDTIFDDSQLELRLKHTDHLVMALPATPQTNNIMDEKRLSMLPPNATLTNVGRGNALDEKALVRLLQGQRLLGAVLDVFKNEPLDEHNPLRTCPNLWTLPHASAIAENYLDLYAREIVEDLSKLMPHILND